MTFPGLMHGPFSSSTMSTTPLKKTSKLPLGRTENEDMLARQRFAPSQEGSTEGTFSCCAICSNSSRETADHCLQFRISVPRGYSPELCSLPPASLLYPACRS